VYEVVHDTTFNDLERPILTQISRSSSRQSASIRRWICL